jgi:tol-pal system protein YbgF
MKSVLAFVAGMLVGVLITFGGGLLLPPAHSVRIGAEREVFRFLAEADGLQGRIVAVFNATPPSAFSVRRHVVYSLRMMRTGVVLAHHILPDPVNAAPAVLPADLSPVNTSSAPVASVAPEAAVPPAAEATGTAPASVVSAQAALTGAASNPQAPSVGDPDERYALALKAYEHGRHEEARARFEAFLHDFPGHRLNPNALYWIGETWYSQARYAEAAEAFAQVLREFPRHAKSPDALLKLAYTAMRQGRTGEARSYLDQLQARYPDSGASRLGRRARGRLEGSSGEGTVVVTRG